MKRLTSQGDLPLVLSPADVAEILGISRNTAYDVIHSKGFPAFRVGKQYRVSRERFLTWLTTTR